MFILNEPTKKFLKIVGIIIGILLLWGILNLFTDRETVREKSPLLGQGTMAPAGNLKSMLSPETGRMTEGDTGDEPFIYEEDTTDKKVIKNGNLNLKVEKTEKVAEEISQIVKMKGGEIFSTNFYEQVKGQKSGSITVKVSTDKFEETIIEIKKVATQVISEFTTGQDVTEQYTDLRAQLKNKRAEEESFVKILDRAGKIDDVLAVTREIARVRGEIERLEGRIKYLESQTDMATIFVNLSEDVEVTSIGEAWRPWQVVKKSFSELIENIQDFVDGVIRFTIVTLPSLIVFLLVIWIVWVVGKRIHQKIRA